MRGGPSRDRVRVPSIKEDLGEDPARWLDRDLTARPTYANVTTDDRGHTHVDVVPDSQVSTDGEMVIDRIKSIDSLELIEAWRAVERLLADKHDRDVREPIINALDERKETLEEIGERPDRLVMCDPDDVPSTESVATWDTDDGEQRTIASASSSFRAATDGGRDRGMADASSLVLWWLFVGVVCLLALWAVVVL